MTDSTTTDDAPAFDPEKHGAQGRALRSAALKLAAIGAVGTLVGITVMFGPISPDNSMATNVFGILAGLGPVFTLFTLFVAAFGHMVSQASNEAIETERLKP